MTTSTTAGEPPSGVVAPGHADRTRVGSTLWRRNRQLAVDLLTYGRTPRVGYDHRRPWPQDFPWSDYAARVPIGTRSGPWTVNPRHETDDSATAVVAAAEGMPHAPGWYTSLDHDERGIVMSDVPGEVAGCLDFLDRARGRVLIAGLGLGIVPAWLLQHADVERIDVLEIDADVIALTAGFDGWQADPRLHIHHVDAHTWTPPAGARWHCLWADIWDTVSYENLPSMDHLATRYSPVVDWHLSWEEPECREALARGRTHPRPLLGCHIREDLYE